MSVLEILDPSGHVTLSWDASDPESVARAGAEFDRLRAAGYAFFATGDEDAASVTKLTKKVLTESASVDVRVAEDAEESAGDVRQTKAFNKKARRTVAVPPMRGG